MYKVRNKLECPIKFGKVIFAPNEVKIMKEKPTSDRFHVEKLEEQEKKKNLKGGKKD